MNQNIKRAVSIMSNYRTETSFYPKHDNHVIYYLICFKWKKKTLDKKKSLNYDEFNAISTAKMLLVTVCNLKIV